MFAIVLAVFGAFALGAFYIGIIYSTYDTGYAKSGRILAFVSTGMLLASTLLLFYASIPTPAIRFGHALVDDLIDSAILAPIVEETVKLWAFYFLFFRHNPRISPYEGMFSFALLGLGFAIVENSDYSSGTSSEMIIRGGSSEIMYCRSFPGHVLFNGIAGYWIGHSGHGAAKEGGKALPSKSSGSSHMSLDLDFIGKGYMIALGAHAAWNAFATLPGGGWRPPFCSDWCPIVSTCTGDTCAWPTPWLNGK